MIDIVDAIRPLAEARGCTISQLALAWVMSRLGVTAPLVGPRTLEQFEDNLKCLDVSITPEDEAFIDDLVPVGEHSGKGFQDTAYPIDGRPV